MSEENAGVDVIRLNGTDDKLYALVAPLVMNPLVLRQNNNYPFKTSNRYVWYVALEDGTVAGFMPVKKNGKGWHVDNYYVRDDRKEIIAALLRLVIADAEDDLLLTALVHKRHVEAFEEEGFRREKMWTHYEKMEYKPTLDV
ncbi:MAG: hypothetical protein LUC45_09860 [Paraprevotella sp.]|nr:hypothetical protein [Paraprevotella sp.]